MSVNGVAGLLHESAWPRNVARVLAMAATASILAVETYATR